MPVNGGAFSCSDVNCSNSSHCCEIDDQYSDVAQILCDSSMNTIRISAAKQFRAVVGWNDFVERFHDDAKSNYI